MLPSCILGGGHFMYSGGGGHFMYSGGGSLHVFWGGSLHVFWVRGKGAGSILETVPFTIMIRLHENFSKLSASIFLPFIHYVNQCDINAQCH